MSSTPFTRRRERYQPAVSPMLRLGTLTEESPDGTTVYQTIPFEYPSAPLTYRQATWDSIHKGPPYKDGGDFASVKIEMDANSIKGQGTYKEPTSHNGPHVPKIWKYVGGFNRPIFGWETSMLPSYMAIGTESPYDSGFIQSVEDIGAEAYDRLRPRLEKAGGSVFLAEARDLPRMLETTAANFNLGWKSLGGNTSTPYMSGSKRASDNFLNHQFGWVPFISDLIKFDKVYRNSKDYIARITRENGTWVRKARSIDQTESQVVVRTGDQGGIPWRFEFLSMCDPVILPGGNYWHYRYTQVLRTSTRTWATGSFKYYRPEFDDTLADFESAWNRTYRLLTVYGVRVNPSVLYQMCPWSWLVDWFTNIGAIIDRAVQWATDAVVSRWMFLMHSTTTTLDHIVTVNWKSGSRSMVWQNKIYTKLRQQASTPYSFSLGGPLTARQLAILSALGISRKG